MRCSNATDFNDGREKINVRFNVELETDACHYLEMCCDPEDVLLEDKYSFERIPENNDIVTTGNKKIPGENEGVGTQFVFGPDTNDQVSL